MAVRLLLRQLNIGQNGEDICRYARRRKPCILVVCAIFGNKVDRQIYRHDSYNLVAGVISTVAGTKMGTDMGFASTKKIENVTKNVLTNTLKYDIIFTAQHSTAQHSTAQHSTAQHSTAQHSTAF